MPSFFILLCHRVDVLPHQGDGITRVAIDGQPIELHVATARSTKQSPTGEAKGNHQSGQRPTEQRVLSAEEQVLVDRVIALDEAEGRRLVREYGDELLEYLRWEPLTTLKELASELARARRQVKDTVKGLYEGVDVSQAPTGLTFDSGVGVVEENGVKVVRTWVRDTKGAEGYFERAYDPTTKELELSMAFLRMAGEEVPLPSMVGKQGTSPEMVEGKGTPMVQYVTMHQMRMLGVSKGGGATGVEKIHMSDIQNVETIVHLHYLRKKTGADADALIEHTASVKYALTTATQTGYERSSDFLIMSGQVRSIRPLLEFQEKGNAVRRRENDQILAKYGFDRDTVMLWGFDIDFS